MQEDDARQCQTAKNPAPGASQFSYTRKARLINTPLQRLSLPTSLWPFVETGLWSSPWHTSEAGYPQPGRVGRR